MTTPENQSLFREVVHRRLQEILAESLADTYALEIREMIERYLSRPARYIRPRLVLAAARAYGDRDLSQRDGSERERGKRGHSGASLFEPGIEADSPVVSLSVATELLHVFALLHDDRVDTPCREGEFSAGTALLAGDLLFAEGYGLIAETVERYRLAPEILQQVRHVASRTVVGQAADVTFRRAHGDTPTLADLYHLYDLKTGLYTIAAPLQIGALAAGCHPKEVAALEAVAIPLGRAFQMRDDLDDIASVCAARVRGAERAARAGASAAGAAMASEPPAPIPPWELNLAVTCAAEFARRGGDEPEPEPVPDDAAFLAALDVSELERLVTAEIERLVREALGAVEHLDLSAERRGDLVRELADTLTSLTFPCDEANTGLRTYGHK